MRFERLKTIFAEKMALTFLTLLTLSKLFNKFSNTILYSISTKSLHLYFGNSSKYSML
jgi:hypothetical protein